MKSLCEPLTLKNAVLPDGSFSGTDACLHQLSEMLSSKTRHSGLSSPQTTADHVSAAATGSLGGFLKH